MALLEKISDDMKVALKSGKKLRLETLRMIRAGLLEKQVEKRPSGGMTGEDEVAVLIAAAKKRKEAVTIYREKGREDLARTEEEELGIIQEYLPKQLTAAEIEELVKKTISASGAATAKDFGKVMPLVMKELKGRADGKLVQEIVKRTLGM
ncbi:MAG: glutamyl-tRNA amidotransferase [Ignavibacteria bacterium 13_1_40CM_2_61_4]|nr:MAG: glutamyl-tRNA amidotransferase [Ignavibacteria bacterium 13_1_40CM_2_61_4]